MRRLIVFGLLLSLVACEEPPVMELAVPASHGFNKAVSSHALSGTSTTATRIKNISATATFP